MYSSSVRRPCCTVTVPAETLRVAAGRCLRERVYSFVSPGRGRGGPGGPGGSRGVEVRVPGGVRDRLRARLVGRAEPWWSGGGAWQCESWSLSSRRFRSWSCSETPLRRATRTSLAVQRAE